MVTFRNWKVASGVLAASVLLGALIGFNAFTLQVEAQKIANPNKPADPTFCLPAQVQHWDKIIFKLETSGNVLDSNGVIVDGSIAEPPLIPIVRDPTLDIKVRDFPHEVAFLEQKVAIFLNEQGWTVEEFGISRSLIEDDVVIIDVEYAIVCTN